MAARCEVLERYGCSACGQPVQAGVVLDDCGDAVAANVKIWAWAFMRDPGYHNPLWCRLTLLLLMSAPRHALRRVLPCDRWFLWSQGLHRPGPLLQQAISACCMRALLRFKMGAHSLPNVLGRRSGSSPLLAM